MSEYIAKAPIEPRDYRVVFLIQQEKGDVLPPFFSYVPISAFRLSASFMGKTLSYILFYKMPHRI